MNSKRLLIINKRKSLKRNKTWHKKKSGFQCYFGLTTIEQIASDLIKEILKSKA